MVRWTNIISGRQNEHSKLEVSIPRNFRSLTTPWKSARAESEEKVFTAASPLPHRPRRRLLVRMKCFKIFKINLNSNAVYTAQST